MFGEIPRVKFEKGVITIDIFTYNNPIPIIHIKGNLKDKKVQEQIKFIRAKFGDALFSDILDFISFNKSYKDIKKELEEIAKKE